MRKRLKQTALLLSCALLLACQSDQEKLATHMARGKEYAEAKKWEEAIIEYKNVLQIDPNDADAHFQLSQAYLKNEQPREGFWELRETVRLDPSHQDARLQFGQISIYAGELEEALKQADAVIAVAPERADAWMVRGQALDALKRPDEAREAYAKATEVEPGNVGARVLYATFLRRQGDRDAAREQYVAATRAEGAEAPSFFALGGFLDEGGETDAAEATYRKALEIAEEDQLATAYSVLGTFLYRHERREEAYAVLEEGISKASQPVELIYLLARMYLEQGDNARADAVALRATEVRPDDPGPFLVLSAYRGQVGDLQGALAAAESAAKVAKEGDPSAKLRVSELLLEIGFREGGGGAKSEQVERGRKIVEEVLAKDPEQPSALFVKAKLDIAEGRVDDGIRGLRAAIDKVPDWAKAHFLLGTALAMSGERTAARTELARALEIDPTLVDARRVLADVHAALGEHEYAVEEGRRYLAVNPNSTKTRVRVAQSLVLLGKLDEALAEVEAIDESQRDVDTNYAIGRIYTGMKRYDEARKYLLIALEQRPGTADILSSLLDVDRAQGRVDESVARIEQALTENPDDAHLQQLAGELAMAQNRAADAEAAFKRAIELDPNLISSYRQLAQFYARTGRTGETIKTYEQSLAVKPDQPQVHHFLGVLYEFGGQKDLAVEHYEKAIRYEPNLAEAKNNLAYLYAEQGDKLDRALDLAQEAKALMPDNPNAADTLGWVLYRRGVPSAAIGYLREAVAALPANDPNLGLVRHHLALAYEASGDTDAARETLDQALADHQSFVDAQKAAGANPGAEPQWIAEAKALRAKL